MPSDEFQACLNAFIVDIPPEKTKSHLSEYRFCRCHHVSGKFNSSIAHPDYLLNQNLGADEFKRLLEIYDKYPQIQQPWSIGQFKYHRPTMMASAESATSTAAPSTSTAAPAPTKESAAAEKQMRRRFPKRQRKIINRKISLTPNGSLNAYRGALTRLSQAKLTQSTASQETRLGCMRW